MIQLNRLEGFYWVARTGGYSKAARAFPYPITQPAVHQQVKKLEGEVGVPLFERVGRDKILLTPAGKKLYDFVTPFYAGLDPLVRSLRDGDYGGTLKIHAAALFLRHLLPPWLRRLQRKHPSLRVELSELTRLDTDPLERGETDLVVSYLPLVGEGTDTRVLATALAFLVLPADHPVAKRKRVGLQELAEDAFIAYPSGTFRHELQIRELERHGVRPDRILTATSADTILGFVASGLGYSLVPSLRRDGPRVKGIVARPFGTKRLRYPVVAAWRKSAADNPLVQAALEAAPRP